MEDPLQQYPISEPTTEPISEPSTDPRPEPIHEPRSEHVPEHRFEPIPDPIPDPIPALLPDLHHAPYGVGNGELLSSFEHHIAYRIWHHPEAAPRRLRVHQRPGSLAFWRRYRLIPRGEVVEGTWWYYASLSGLTGLRTLQFGSVDHVLISAFVERWHPETNNFHFSWGEITVTLHDVERIMGLPIEGYTVSAVLDDGALADLWHEVFDYDPVEVGKWVATRDSWG